MMLFIRDVPRNVSRKELKDSIQNALEPRFRLPFRSVPTVEKAQFLLIFDKDTGVSERHGLVLVSNRKMDDSAVNRVRRVRLNGRVCPVRPYVQRKTRNDRRRYDQGLVSAGLDQRHRDRRRGNLEVELERKPYVEGLAMGSPLNRAAS